MALSNYGELKTTVANWLNRGDLTSYIPDFITLAHRRIDREQRWYREMYSVVNAQNFSYDATPTALPVYVKDVLSVFAADGSDFHPIDVVTPDEWRDRKHASAGAAGTPVFAVIVPTTSTILQTTGLNLFLEPAPSAGYELDLWYVRSLPVMAANGDTNAMLTLHPDTYLFGALAESAPFLKHDERAQLWEEKYQRAIATANAQAESFQYSASRKRVALPTTF